MFENGQRSSRILPEFFAINRPRTVEPHFSPAIQLFRRVRRERRPSISGRSTPLARKIQDSPAPLHDALAVEKVSAGAGGNRAGDRAEDLPDDPASERVVNVTSRGRAVAGAIDRVQAIERVEGIDPRAVVNDVAVALLRGRSGVVPLVVENGRGCRRSVKCGDLVELVVLAGPPLGQSFPARMSSLRLIFSVRPIAPGSFFSSSRQCQYNDFRPSFVVSTRRRRPLTRGAGLPLRSKT